MRTTDGQSRPFVDCDEVFAAAVVFELFIPDCHSLKQKRAVVRPIVDGLHRRFKDDAREVREGFECGIGLSDFQDLKPGDIIETYEEREIARV